MVSPIGLNRFMEMIKLIGFLNERSVLIFSVGFDMNQSLSKNITVRPTSVAFFIGKSNIESFPKVAGIREDRAVCDNTVRLLSGFFVKGG